MAAVFLFILREKELYPKGFSKPFKGMYVFKKRIVLCDGYVNMF